MRTIQMTIDEVLLNRVDSACHSLGMARSAFIRHALEHSLRKLKISDMERQHKAGYIRMPVQPGEFDVWENEQDRGDA